mmetsp:Transcript_20677/g.52671  ORF Transcript_20677/g.52671 Transcript_20677/m.52671 type:complete len:200 (-) Transcript_20677:380-979(-)
MPARSLHAHLGPSPVRALPHTRVSACVWSSLMPAVRGGVARAFRGCARGGGVPLLRGLPRARWPRHGLCGLPRRRRLPGRQLGRCRARRLLSAQHNTHQAVLRALPVRRRLGCVVLPGGDGRAWCNRVHRVHHLHAARRHLLHPARRRCRQCGPRGLPRLPLGSLYRPTSGATGLRAAAASVGAGAQGRLRNCHVHCRL